MWWKMEMKEKTIVYRYVYMGKRYRRAMDDEEEEEASSSFNIILNKWNNN
jgi:hypothetical protein